MWCVTCKMSYLIFRDLFNNIMMNSTNYCTQWTEDVLPMLWNITHRIQVQKNQSYWVFHPALNRCWWVLKPLNVSASHIIMLWWISRGKETLGFFIAKGWCSSFTEALLSCFSCFFNISLTTPNPPPPALSLNGFFAILLFYVIMHAARAVHTTW